MTDNMKRTPDDVLANAKAALEARLHSYSGNSMARLEAAHQVAASCDELIAALDAALARNRELEAQIARLREAGREMLNDYRFIARKTGLYGSESKLNTWYALFADDTQADADARAKGE